MSRLLFAAFASAVIVGVLFLLSAGPGAETPATAAAGGVTLADVAANPERFVSQRVTVTGEVDEAYARGAFALSSGGRDDVVVLPRGNRSAPAGLVRVTGTVRRVGSDLESVLGGDLAVRDGGAAIVATSVERVGCARGPGCDAKR